MTTLTNTESAALNMEVLERAIYDVKHGLFWIDRCVREKYKDRLKRLPARSRHTRGGMWPPKPKTVFVASLYGMPVYTNPSIPQGQVWIINPSFMKFRPYCRGWDVAGTT